MFASFKTLFNPLAAVRAWQTSQWEAQLATAEQEVQGSMLILEDSGLRKDDRAEEERRLETWQHEVEILSNRLGKPLPNSTTSPIH